VLLRHLLIAVFLTGILHLPPASAAARPWVRIDTRTETLAVVRDGRVVDTIHGIALGRGGVSRDRVRGDERTPLGRFRVAWVNDDSPFRRFYGLDYPNRAYARRALAEGRIDRGTYRQILTALRGHRIPPQNTSLGGYVGIHGLGRASPRIHRLFNWTRGCIAVTNTQIDRLGRWMAVGTTVVIK